jgi:hypothetical protein
MGSLNRRLESIEARRKRRGDQQRREALARFSDVELEAAEESLLAEARARGEQPPPTNELLEKFKQLEIEATEQQRRHAEKSRMRGTPLESNE